MGGRDQGGRGEPDPNAATGRRPAPPTGRARLDQPVPPRRGHKALSGLASVWGGSDEHQPPPTHTRRSLLTPTHPQTAAAAQGDTMDHSTHKHLRRLAADGDTMDHSSHKHVRRLAAKDTGDHSGHKHRRSLAAKDTGDHSGHKH